MGKEKRQKEEKPGKRKKKSHRLYALVVFCWESRLSRWAF